jgi:hypothetical protein
MLVRTWRLLAVMLTALSMAPAVGHLLEMPAKMSYDGALWLRVSQTLYATFGTIGAAFEVGAVVSTVILAILVRKRKAAFAWTFWERSALWPRMLPIGSGSRR